MIKGEFEMNDQFDNNSNNNNDQEPIDFSNINDNPYAAYNGNSQNPVQNDPGRGLAIASLVCGIISFFCCGVPCGIAAVICGFLARNKGSTSGMATAGIVCGIAGAVLAIVCIFFMWVVYLPLFAEIFGEMQMY